MNKLEVENKLKDNKLPEGWKRIRLGEVAEYEQPQKYIVSDERYDESIGIPVLTAGKSFILGYTDEQFGICKNLPVIIFDDFTTDSRYINFSFKLKSSAIKILKTRDNEYNLFFIYNVMQNLNFKPGSGHKRFWISEYSKISIPYPPLSEQQKIAEILETVNETIEKTDAIIKKYKRIKQGLMQDLLTEGIDENGQIRNEKTHKFKDSPLGRIPDEWEVIELGKIADITSSKRIYFSEYVNEGVSFYRSKEIIEKAVGKDPTSLLYIPLSKFNYLKRKFGIPEAGDILITAVGTLGIPYIIKEDDIFYFKDGNLLWLKKFKKDICEKYLFYILKPLFNLQEEILKIGTSQQALTIEKLRKMKIFSLPLSEQRRIAKVLSKIDDTIEKEQKYKEKLKQIKEGLMEDLLTGKVRVNLLIKEGLDR